MSQAWGTEFLILMLILGAAWHCYYRRIGKVDTRARKPASPAGEPAQSLGRKSESALLLFREFADAEERSQVEQSLEFTSNSHRCGMFEQRWRGTDGKTHAEFSLFEDRTEVCAIRCLVNVDARGVEHGLRDSGTATGGRPASGGGSLPE
jgi:hypothetical protein